MEEVMILIEELWDIVTCFRLKVRMTEMYGGGIPERKGATLSFVTIFQY
jgi:hypothetical protein